MICHSCNKEFTDFKSLAIHISTSKTGHKKGKKWAAKYLMINGLSAKNRFERKEYAPLTDEERESKENSHMELSGETKCGDVFCPQCRRLYSRTVEVEYINSSDSLRQGGALVITCTTCGGKA